MDRRAARSSRHLVTDADKDASEPGLEAIGLTQAGQLPPGDDECLLHGIVGQVELAEDPSRDAEQPVTMRANEDGEGVPITTLGLLDEVAIHPAHHAARPT